MTQSKRASKDDISGTEKKTKRITDFFAPVKKFQSARPQEQEEEQDHKPAANIVDAKDADTSSSNEQATTDSDLKNESCLFKSKTLEPTGPKKLNSIDSNQADVPSQLSPEEPGTHKEGLGVDKSQQTGHSYGDFCTKYSFDRQIWIASLSEEQRMLLDLEIQHLHVTWLAFLHQELTKPYFLELKKFLHGQKGKTVFPKPQDIYSWSHYTPLPEVKCLILGQDPYHNFNQAHGLAFSVLEPTRPPPSLLNIYKTLKIDFPDFVIPDYKELSKQGKPGGGNLTKWAKRGVLMLNACLTVEAHKANSHANRGWEQFTEKAIEAAIMYAINENKHGFVIMAWGTPAQKRVSRFSLQLAQKNVSFLVLSCVHPSPLSARRGFFESQVFKKCNMWLTEQGRDAIDWGLLEGNHVQ